MNYFYRNFPQKCTLSYRFNLNLTYCPPQDNNTEKYVSNTSSSALTVGQMFDGWIAWWPSGIIAGFAGRLIVTNVMVIKKYMIRSRSRNGNLTKLWGDSIWTRIAMKNVDFLPLIAFCVAAYAWSYINMYTCTTKPPQY